MSQFPNLAVEELKRRVKAAGSQIAAAEKLGIPQSQLSEILSGRRDVSDSILEKIGFTKIEIDIPVEDAERLVRAIEPTIVTLQGAKRLEGNFKKQIKQVARS